MRRGAISTSHSRRNISTGNQFVHAITVTADYDGALTSEKELWDVFLSFDESTRFSVANSLASVKNDLSRMLLMKILKTDPSPLVRHEAAFAIGCVGNEACLPLLTGTLTSDKSFLVRHEVAMALSELGGQEEIRILKRGLRDRSREVVISCRVAIQRISERLVNNGTGNSSRIPTDK